jgi:hypothetical protein
VVTQVSDTVIAGPIESQFSQDVFTTSGLTFGIKAGIYVNGTVVTNFADTTVTLTDNAFNQIYIDIADLTSIKVAAAAPVTNTLMLFEVTVVAGAITNTIDLRNRITSR